MNVGKKVDFDVIIVGGGLAGLTASVLLSGENKKVLLIEKKVYPFHKVCGEYVSNEVLKFLQSCGFNPFVYGASIISKLRISTPGGKNIYSGLEMGGFGLSRYIMDHALFQLAVKNGTTALTATRVSEIEFKENYFQVKTSEGDVITSNLVIGCYGKRDNLDKRLGRKFIRTHTGYLGVKYHIKTALPPNEISLDNFENGYCGIVKIEDDKYNLCYLYRRRKGAAEFNSIRELEEKILFKNPVIKKIFSDSDFLFPQPEVINEISFAPKSCVENHILMCGDSAGLITPLCGNGMSMAIHSAKNLSEIILESRILDNQEIPDNERTKLELEYAKAWKYNFSRRLSWGRSLQNIFGNTALTGISIHLIHAIPYVERLLISKTHGKVIQ
jgi:flavin-dependent dehydrogenase